VTVELILVISSLNHQINLPPEVW